MNKHRIKKARKFYAEKLAPYALTITQYKAAKTIEKIFKNSVINYAGGIL